MRSHVIAYVALFFALTGTAMALPGTNTVFSDDIVNGDVKSADIADGKVNSIDIHDNQVRSPDIFADAVDSSEITASAIRGNELLGYHVHPGTSVNVTDTTALNGDWTQANATATCSAGEQLVGAYAEWTTGGDEDATQEIVPDFNANSVSAHGITDNGPTETFRAVAVCLFD